MKVYFNKRLAAIMAAAVMAAGSCMPVFGAIPQAYWQYQDPFQQAIDSGNKEEAIRLGKEIIGVFEGQETDTDKANILNGVYSKLDTVYESLGRYDEAIAALQKHSEFSQFLGFDDSVKLAQARIKKIDPMTQVYALSTKATGIPFYNSKNEPQNGAYYGRVYTDESKDLVSGESAVSFYVECLQENAESFDYMIRPYADGKRVIHIALNMPQENDTLQTILNSNTDAYFTQTMEYLKSLNTPVLLRVGGEMNAWTKLADANSFKQVFIKIAEKAHQIAPNVAVVFSPNDISNWNVDINDYYPGDQYVDWVGVSLYTNQYRNPNAPAAGADHEEMYYGNGVYANPIAKLRDIVDRYGDRKPIIITEGGSGYRIKGTSDLTNFAKNRIDTLYTYVNMVYPQVKGIIYFDTDVNKSLYSYDLKNSNVILNAYRTNTANNKAFIGENRTPLNYVKAENYHDTMEEVSLYTYCGLRNDIPVTVTYTLDGVNKGTTRQQPYQCSLKSSEIALGAHTLTVQATGDNGYQKIMDYQLTKNADGSITIKK